MGDKGICKFRPSLCSSFIIMRKMRKVRASRSGVEIKKKMEKTKKIRIKASK
jgi:hypothetical protein